MKDTVSGCSVEEAMHLLGGRWRLLIVSYLVDGPKRFNELRRLIPGISQRMLTLTLRTLERDGMISRTVTPSIPPRVDYALTERGRSSLAPLAALHKWAQVHSDGIEASRRDFDERAE